jgi:hypothetical protein
VHLSQNGQFKKIGNVVSADVKLSPICTTATPEVIRFEGNHSSLMPLAVDVAPSRAFVGSGSITIFERPAFSMSWSLIAERKKQPTVTTLCR